MYKYFNLRSFFKPKKLFIVFTVLALMVTGGLNIFSVTYFDNNNVSTIFLNQILFYIVGFLSILLIGTIDLGVIKNKKFFIFINIITLILMISVLLFGQEILGAKRWLDLGIFTIQPGEFSKITMIYNISYLLEVKLNNYKFINKKFIKVILLVLFTLPYIFLIYLQKSLGNTLITAGVFLMMILFMQKIKIKHLIYLCLLVLGFWWGFLFQVYTIFIDLLKLLEIIPIIVIFFVISYFCKYIFKTSLNWGLILTLGGFLLNSLFFFSYSYVLKDYQRERIDTFLFSSNEDSLDENWNRDQSLIACGSGRLTGKGFMQGTHIRNSLIPFPETDFAYCSLVEQFGFLGGLFIITLYILLLVSLLLFTKNQSIIFNNSIVNGSVSVILLNTLQHIGMNLGYLPITGVPLPLISSGGSYVLVVCALIGLVLSSDFENYHKVKIIDET